MRTTLDIDDDVLAEVRHRAAARRISAGRYLSDLARRALTTEEFAEGEDVSAELPPVPGFRPFPKREGAVVTRELVKRLMDED